MKRDMANSERRAGQEEVASFALAQGRIASPAKEMSKSLYYFEHRGKLFLGGSECMTSYVVLCEILIAMKEVLTKDPPFGAEVSFENSQGLAGWAGASGSV